MDARDLQATQKVPASRKLGRDEAAELLAGASTLHVAKGKKLTSFEGEALQSEDALLAMLGPTGNLRAPTLKVGKTVVVGYDEALFTDLFD